MLIVAWETTAACNLKCGYCRASAAPAPEKDELCTDEALGFIDQMAQLRPMLILSGGEPLLRPDIFLLARHAVSLGLRVSLASNGTLITPEIAAEIAASGISRVSISLDGATAERHDRSRGMGTFRQAMAGMESLRGKVDFQINFTITKKNEDQIPAIFALAEAAAARALHFFFLVPTGRGREEDLISAERQQQLLELIDLERMKSSLEVQVTCAPQYARMTGRGRGCLAAKSFIFLSRKGEVYPCGYLPVVAGSIREKGFRDIWETSPVLKALRSRELGGKCGVCGYSESCGGCRARAFAENGDYLGPDPQCLEAC